MERDGMRDASLGMGCYLSRLLIEKRMQAEKVAESISLSFL